MKKGFTLIELVTVIVIIGVLVSFSVPVYTRAMERARDNEPKTNLMLIQAAEKIYQAEEGAYYGSSDVAAINTNLHLNLNTNFWNYSISGGGANFTATASRDAGGFNRSYSITDSATTVSPSGNCP